MYDTGLETTLCTAIVGFRQNVTVKLRRIYAARLFKSESCDPDVVLYRRLLSEINKHTSWKAMQVKNQCI